MSTQRKEAEVETSFESYNLSNVQSKSKYKNEAWLAPQDLHKIDEQGTPHFNYPMIGNGGLSDGLGMARSSQHLQKAKAVHFQQQQIVELPQVQVKRPKDKKKQQQDHGGLIYTGAALRKSQTRRAGNNAHESVLGQLSNVDESSMAAGQASVHELSQMASLATKRISMNKSSKRNFMISKGQVQAHNYHSGQPASTFSDSEALQMPNLRASHIVDRQPTVLDNPSPPMTSALAVAASGRSFTQSVRATSSGGGRLRASSKKQIDMI